MLWNANAAYPCEYDWLRISGNDRKCTGRALRRGKSCNWLCGSVRLKMALKHMLKNPGEGDVFRTRLNRPWRPPSFMYVGYRVSLPAVERPKRGVDDLPHLAPRLKGQ
jgi:hypothetical protein